MTTYAPGSPLPALSSPFYGLDVTAVVGPAPEWLAAEQMEDALTETWFSVSPRQVVARLISDCGHGDATTAGKGSRNRSVPGPLQGSLGKGLGKAPGPVPFAAP